MCLADIYVDADVINKIPFHVKVLLISYCVLHYVFSQSTDIMNFLDNKNGLSHFINGWEPLVYIEE